MKSTIKKLTAASIAALCMGLTGRQARSACWDKNPTCR